MSPAMTGALAGAVLGLIGFAILRRAADAVEQARRGNNPRRTAGFLRTVALVDLLLLPTVGYYTGPSVIGAP